MHTIHATLRRLAALPILAAACGALTLSAQQTPSANEGSTRSNLQATLKTPTDLLFSDAATSNSSSSTEATDPVSAERLSLAEGLQPPPRRRYGRPRYTDSQHNPDGSNKYTYEIGGGLTLSTGGTHNYLKPSYNFQGGFGRNFSQKVGVIAQFDYANFGIQTNTLNALLAAYNSVGATDSTGAPLSQLGGSSHIWSLTLNPIYNISGSSEKTGAYVVAGAGFYHKTANFTIPSTGTYCDYYYGCYQYAANQSIDKYTSNAFGVNAGVGFTYKPSRFANERFFAEARYVFVDNKPRPYSLGSATSTYFNAFPQNSARTTYIPITVGVRF